MQKIVVINGSNESGKDTFVEYCRYYCEAIVRPKIKTYPMSSIDSVKAAMEKFGITGKSDESRKFMVDLKNMWVKFNDGPFRETVHWAEMFFRLYKVGIVFIHIREPLEIDKVRNYFGNKCITVLVSRPGNRVADNSSDMGVLNYDYDFIVQNNGPVEDFEKMAKTFIDQIMSDRIVVKNKEIEDIFADEMSKNSLRETGEQSPESLITGLLEDGNMLGAEAEITRLFNRNTEHDGYDSDQDEEKAA